MISKEAFFGMFIGRKVFLYNESFFLTIATIHMVLKNIENCKISLRPLSAMTEEQKIELAEMDDIGGLNHDTRLYGIYYLPLQILKLIGWGYNPFEGIVPEDWYTYKEVKNE